MRQVLIPSSASDICKAICSACGKDVGDAWGYNDWKFCPYCGEKL